MATQITEGVLSVTIATDGQPIDPDMQWESARNIMASIAADLEERGLPENVGSLEGVSVNVETTYTEGN